VASLEANNATGTDLALNQPASSSSHLNGGTLAGNVTDGSDDTIWATANMTSATEAEQWVRVDLSAAKAVRSTTVTWRNTYTYIPWAWKLQTGNSTAGPWTDIKAFTNYPKTNLKEEIDMRQTATLSGAGWSSSAGDLGTVTYLREYGFDKVGNRTSMRLLDDDALQVLTRLGHWSTMT